MKFRADLAISFSGIITTTIRLVEIFRIRFTTDITWHFVDAMTWVIIEPGVYLIAACLPSLRSLIKPLSKTLNIRPIGAWFKPYSSKISLTRYTTKDASLTDVNNRLEKSDTLSMKTKGPGDPLQRSFGDRSDENNLVTFYEEQDTLESDGFNILPAPPAPVRHNTGIRAHKSYGVSTTQTR